MQPPTVIRRCPSATDDFEPLSEYQAQTPDTFFDGKPVLHCHDDHVKAWVSAEQYENLFIFSKDSPNPTGLESSALDSNAVPHLREEKVQVFVSSSNLTLFCHKNQIGIEIPYPAITLHAIKNFTLAGEPDLNFTGVYMQLEFSRSGGDDDEVSDPIELTLVPSSDIASIAPQNNHRATMIFKQISACSNLHPDPTNEDDEADEDDDFDRIVFEGNVEGNAGGDAVEGLPGVFQGDLNGGLPPPMPGSSGWITAENVDDFFDANGNWIGGEEGVSGELGDGAGRVRGHDEMDEDVPNGQENGEDTESKRPRTE